MPLFSPLRKDLLSSYLYYLTKVTLREQRGDGGRKNSEWQNGGMQKDGGDGKQGEQGEMRKIDNFQF